MAAVAEAVAEAPTGYRMTSRRRAVLPPSDGPHGGGL